jgi:hypothetical protein
MSRRSSVRSFLRNLAAGEDAALTRAGKLVRNLSRRRLPPYDCCGNYGEPGC